MDSSSNYEHIRCRIVNNLLNNSYKTTRSLIFILFESDNKVVIINPKVGDRVLSNNTDEKMNELSARMEATEKENKTVSNNSEDEDETKQASSKTPPCTWKFYLDKKNDNLYKIGHRIVLTFLKVILV